MVKFKVDDSNYNKIYPIGSIYMSINETNPSELFGGEWEQIKDTFLLASGDTYSNGSTGGEATHTLTTNEMPTHSHSIGKGGALHLLNNSATASGSGHVTNWSNHYNTQLDTNDTGGGQPHNNMPPYLAVNVWVRIA